MKELLLRVFDLLQYIETILPLMESLKMRYILWVVALLEACDVTSPTMVGILATILDFTMIRNQVKTARNGNFFRLACQITQKFASFYPQCLLSLTKEAEKTCICTQKWLDYLLLITSYLVTIVTGHH